MLRCIFEFIGNVTIGSSKSFYNDHNLRVMFNSMCEQISKIVSFGLSKLFTETVAQRCCVKKVFSEIS